MTLKQKIYEFKRKKYLKKILALKGKTSIKIDRIICFVNNRYLLNNKSSITEYNYNFYYDINQKIKKYNLDKPIYYIIKDMNFIDSIDITVPKNVYVIFDNCTFN